MVWCATRFGNDTKHKKRDVQGGGPQKEDDGAIEFKIPMKHFFSK